MEMFPMEIEFQDNEYWVTLAYWENGELHLNYRIKGEEEDVIHAEKKGLSLEELIENWPEDGVEEE